jgi:hypothetical protein
MPRKEGFDPTEVGIYHCINRCVRRSFLCGCDVLTGRSFEYHKQWLQDRLAALGGVFACDLLSFSTMSNHFLLVVRNRPDLVAGCSDVEVARRWYGVPNEKPSFSIGTPNSRPKPKRALHDTRGKNGRRKSLCHFGFMSSA